MPCEGTFHVSKINSGIQEFVSSFKVNRAPMDTGQSLRTGQQLPTSNLLINEFANKAMHLLP